MSKPIALLAAIVAALCAIAGGFILWGGSGRSTPDADVIGWIDPMRVQASVVERTVVDTDRLLRLFIVQGRENDAKEFLRSRGEAAHAVEGLSTLAQSTPSETAEAAAGVSSAVTRWLDFADDWYKAANEATGDAGRVSVLLRMGPEDPLADMIKERKALDQSLEEAREERLAVAGSQPSLRTVFGFALVLTAAGIALWMTTGIGRPFKSTDGTVDIGLLRTLLDLIPEGVAIFDEKGEVIVANLTAARVIDAPGTSTHRLNLYDSEGMRLPEDRAPLMRALSGQHVHDQDIYAERLDGELSPVDVHAEPVFDEGRASAAVVVLRDNSEARRVEAEYHSIIVRAEQAESSLGELTRQLKTAEIQLNDARTSLDRMSQQAETTADRFTRVFGNISVIGAALFSAADFKLLEVNEPGLVMLGERRRARDVRGSLLTEIVPGAETSGLVGLFRKVAISGEPFASQEYLVQGLRHGQGYWRFALIPTAPQPGASIDQLILLGLDITDEVETRATTTTAQLAAGAWSVEDVLLAISNDLRTPILSIQGMVEIFRSKYAEAVPDVTALHYLELTQRNADQIATLIDELVELSGLGHSEMHASEIPLAALIEEAWRTSPRPGIELRVAGPLPTVRADRSKLLRALRDLFDTAAKYRKDGEGAWMHVKVRDLGSQWEIELTDNGKGFAPEEVEGLFGPLARSVVNVPNNGGPTLVASGLGLAAVRRISELHGGVAGIKSGAGEGTIYSFTIDK